MRSDDLVAGYARVRAGICVQWLTRVATTIAWLDGREVSGEKRRVDSINDSFEYSGIILQRPGARDRIRPAAVANYRCTFGVRFRGEFVTVTLASLIGIGSRLLFDRRRGDASLRWIIAFDATREIGRRIGYNASLIKWIPTRDRWPSATSGVKCIPRARKEIATALKHSRRLRNITLDVFSPPVNYFFDDRAFTQRFLERHGRSSLLQDASYDEGWRTLLAHFAKSFITGTLDARKDALTAKLVVYRCLLSWALLKQSSPRCEIKLPRKSADSAAVSRGVV